MTGTDAPLPPAPGGDPGGLGLGAGTLSPHPRLDRPPEGLAEQRRTAAAHSAPPEPTKEPTKEPTQEPPEPTAEPTEEPEGEIEGVEWVLNSALPGTEITALFQGGTVTGSSGCNTYTAGYQLDGNGITISAPTSSQLACEDNIMAQEATYLTALTNASSYQVRGDALTLSGAASLVYSAR